jgi:hypothetical protein
MFEASDDAELEWRAYGCAYGMTKPSNEHIREPGPARRLAVIEFDRRVRKAKIVRRRSAPGFRLVLSLMTLAGMPIAETVAEPFETAEAARSYAVSEFGADLDVSLEAAER